MTTALAKRLKEAKAELEFSNRKIRDIARDAGYSISDYTVTKYLNGEHGQATRQTIEALAYALRIPLEELSALAGLVEQHGHFDLAGQLKEDASVLNRGQAEAIKEVIRQMAAANRKQVSHSDDTSMYQAGDDYPAHDETEHEDDNQRSEAEEYGLAAYSRKEGVAHDVPLEEQ